MSSSLAHDVPIAPISFSSDGFQTDVQTLAAMFTRYKFKIRVLHLALSLTIMLLSLLL
jgi:hypothetical protein